ncbi:type II secretion system F family protein [Myceligenerans crystallogenes]|uniref:Type II secretion system protein GspF domain-containing protein n=1 Tax=Myceligenerans crystallogenes TaxID=316335 RepID=A0ABN2N5J1_9MICO
MVSALWAGVLAALAVRFGWGPVGRPVAELGIEPPRATGATGATRVARGSRRAARRTAVRQEPARRGARRRRDLPVRVLVLQVVAMLRAGAAPGAAWAGAAGVAVDQAGVPDGTALGRLLGPANALAVVAATRLALDVGAPLGRVLESVADALVRDAEAAAERDAVIAGPRTTARVIVWLPLAGAGLGWLLGVDTLRVVTSGGVGTVAVVLGSGLLVAGWAWTSRLIASARDRPRGDEVDVQVLLDLLAAALGAGSGVPRALGAVGQAAGGQVGAVLRRAGDALVLGARWDQAWAGAPDALRPVTEALRGAWVDGAGPGEALRAAGQEARRQRSADARTAAGRLGVRLVLPLGCCYLPAFVLVGLVPVLLGLGIDLLGGP